MKHNVFSIFANSSRLKLLICLDKSEKNVTELIKNCGLSQSAVSQHLEKLRNANFVTTKRRGKEIIYKLNSKKSAEIAQELIGFEKEVKRNENKKS